MSSYCLCRLLASAAISVVAIGILEVTFCMLERQDRREYPLAAVSSQSVQPDVKPEELRLLVAYMCDFADTEHNFKTSHQELSSMLKPFFTSPGVVQP